MPDIVNYEMTAFDQKENFNLVQKELTKAYKNSSGFPVKRILELFPLVTSSQTEFKERGDIKFNFANKAARSSYSEKQIFSFGDDALGKVYLDAPKVLTAKVSLGQNEGSLTIKINEKFEMQVNRLAEEGLNRSAFQKISTMRFSSDIVVTTLIDVLSENKITNLIVYLNQEKMARLNRDAFFEIFPAVYSEDTTVEGLPVRDLFGLPCADGILGGDGSWLVYRDKSDVPNENGASTCIVDQGRCNFPGPDHVVLQDGFETEEAARNWMNTSNQCIH